MRLQAWRQQKPHSRAAHVSEGCFVHLAVCTQWASLSETSRAPGHFGPSGHQGCFGVLFVSPIFLFFRLKSPVPPGCSSVLKIRAQHRFRKWTFIVLFYIPSPPMSLWERAVEGCFADIVRHLTVVNKKSGDVLVIEANQYPFNKKWIFCCYLALLHWCLWPCAALSLQALAAARRPHEACVSPTRACCSQRNQDAAILYSQCDLSASPWRTCLQMAQFPAGSG